MARIRSIHPGTATDEAYMAMSIYCKAAWPLLWTECDDHGVFEWKPLVLKARIFPTETVNFEQLLIEWERLGSVKKIEIEGKTYGLVHNFCKYQRPKKPSYRVQFPLEYGSFVGLKPISSEPVPHQEGTGSVKCAQMKEEGGRREEERKKDAAIAAPKTKVYFFETGVIRLTEKDFRKWEDSFPRLDLKAELVGLSQWASQQGDWYFAVSGALAKRNRAAKLALERPPPSSKALLPNGEPWPDGII